ncbi:MAG: peptidylprolyl isomerase [Actinomycetota bacterium]
MRRLPVSVAALVLLTSCGNLFTTAAAVVNDRTIEEDRFVRELDFLLADPRFAQQVSTGEQGEQQRRDVARQYLTFLIHQQFVEVYAQFRDLQADRAELDQLLQRQVAELGGQAEFDRILRRAGAGEGDVRHLLEQQLLRRLVAEAIVTERVGEDELRQRYEDRVLEFSEVHVAHILVSSEREARRIRERATPQSFADLARRFSEDTASAQNGGDLGPQRAVDLVGPFARAALRIPVGEIGGPVETDFGFHVLQVIDRQTQSFDEVRETLLEEVRGDVFTDWLLERVEAAEIRVNPRYGTFDDRTGAVIARTRSTPAPAPSVQLEP